jgi:hypothetical protein
LLGFECWLEWTSHSFGAFLTRTTRLALKRMIGFEMAKRSLKMSYRESKCDLDLYWNECCFWENLRVASYLGPPFCVVRPNNIPPSFPSIGPAQSRFVQLLILRRLLLVGKSTKPMRK